MADIQCSGCDERIREDQSFCTHCGEVRPTAEGEAPAEFLTADATPQELDIEIDLESIAPTAEPTAPGADDHGVPDPPPCEEADFTDSLRRRRATLRSKLAEDPRQSKLLFTLAHVHEEAGDIAGAAHYYRHGLEVDPHDGYAAGRLSILEAQLPEPSQAGTRDPGAGTVPAPWTPPGDRTTSAVHAATSAPRTTGALGVPRDTHTTGPRRTGRPQGPAKHGVIQRPTRETPARGIALIAASLVVLVVIPLVIRLVRPGGYWLTGSQTAAVQVEWSPNGTQLAFLEPPQRAGMESFFWGFTDYGESTLRVQKGNRPSELASFEGANASVGGRAVVWGGDRHVAFTTTDHPARIAIADVTTGGPPSLLDGANPSFSPDGRKLVYEKRQARKSRSYERDLHDGTMVRDYRDKWELYVYELATGTESQLTRGGGRSPLWSPDGATIVFERDDYTVKSQSWVDHRRDAERKYNTTSRKIWKSKQLMAVPSYGGLEWVIAEHGVNRFPQFVGENGEALSWVHWDPPQKKGRRIYGDDEWGEHGYADADARFTEAKLMWSAVDGSGKEELLSFATDAVALDTARWTRDGRYLLYTGLTFDRSKLVMNPSMQLYASDFEDKVDLFRFEPATGQRVRLRPSEKHPVRTHPVPSPDGTRLAFRIMRGGIPQVKVVRFSSLEPH